MDRRETEEVIVSAAQAWVSGHVLAILLIAAAPIVGWALLFGLAGIIAAPGAAALVVVGLVVWAWIAGVCREARWKREAAAAAARFAKLEAKLKELHGGKDRYFVREGYRITLMRFDRGNSDRQAGYCWAGSYALPCGMQGREYALVRSAEADMWCDPKRLAHWQTVFEDWVETGVKPSDKTWWMFPDEAAQYAEREAELEQRRKRVVPVNSLAHG